MSENTAVLAVHGGAPARETPIAPAGERFGDEVIALLTEVVHSQKLNCNVGTRVKEFARAFAHYMGMKHGLSNRLNSNRNAPSQNEPVARKPFGCLRTSFWEIARI